MSMKWVSPRTMLKWYPKAASTAFTKNTLVYFNASGYITPAITTSGDHVGIVLKSVASTDADYALNTLLAVEIPFGKMEEFEADATSLTAAKVGTTMDLSDAGTVNGAATSKKVVTLTKYISATKGRFVLNSTFDVLRVATT